MRLSSTLCVVAGTAFVEYCTLGAGEENEKQSGRTDPPIAAPDNHD